MECPICLKEIPYHRADAHVNAHIEGNSDYLLAEQLQEENGSQFMDSAGLGWAEVKEGEDSGVLPVWTEEVDNVQCLNDRALALSLQQQESEASSPLSQLNASAELKDLQEKFGLKSGTAWDQMEETLDRALHIHKITPAFHAVRREALQRAFRDGIEDDFFRTKGVVGSLLDQLRVENYDVSKSVMCAECDHFASSPGDRGFGCGYRNTQMLLSALIRKPYYFQKVFQNRMDIPSIFKLQKLIESAWTNGFDPAGMEQLKGELHNSRKWIGATEVASLLLNLRVRCRIYEFSKPNSDGLHPALFQFIYRHFHSASTASAAAAASVPSSSSIQHQQQQQQRNEQNKNRQSDATDENNRPMPLYLQYSGHSLTVIGMEKHSQPAEETAYALWVLDPGMDCRELRSTLKGISSDFVSKKNAKKRNNKSGHKQGVMRLRRTLAAFQERQYQILTVCDDIMDDNEWKRSKLLQNICVTMT